MAHTIIKYIKMYGILSYSYTSNAYQQRLDEHNAICDAEFRISGIRRCPHLDAVRGRFSMSNHLYWHCE